VDFVFTPWRLEYVQSDKCPDGCIFCKAFENDPSLDNLVLYRDDLVAVMLNRFPYTNGHMLVFPKLHTDSLTGLDASLRGILGEVLTFCEGALRRTYQAHGINVGLNLGQAAGAGITDHLHWHILPRWSGDTNFATLFGELRVIPEDLSGTYERLRPQFPPLIR
jgi:ATP adenylyltransferase